MAHVYNGQLDAFDLYHQVHDSYHSRPSTSVLGGPALPALGHALAGSTGAAISNVSTYPLALIITRLQIQRQLPDRNTSTASHSYASIQDAATKIYNDEGGLQGLYAGLTSDTLKTIADSFLFFLAYNFLRQSRLRSRKDLSSRLSTLDELGVGFVAGAFSKLLTTPLANIVTRRQASSMVSRNSLTVRADSVSTSSIARQIRSEKGLTGFWSGYSASLVLTLNPSLTFFFFETWKRVLIPRRQRSNPSPQATFLLAAISKVMASTVTYPFSLAKTRLQTSSRSTKKDTNLQGRDASSMTSKGTSEPDIRSNNVFSAILHIVQVEGLGALYEGLHGEVLKGFFSHGTTMLVKDIVHKTIIRLYYLVLKLLKKYPNAKTLGKRAKSNALRLSNSAAKNTIAAAESAKGQMQSAVDEAQAVVKRHLPDR